MAKKSTAAKQAAENNAPNENTSAIKADVKELKETVGTLADTVTRLAEIVGRNAKDVPVITSKAFEPMEQDMGRTAPAQFTEDAGTSDEATLINPRPESIQDGTFDEKMLNERFMQEMVTVHIHDTAEKNADPCFEIQVNGLSEFFIRGQKKTVKRFFVEGLARAKPWAYKNEEYTTPDGVRAVRWPSNRGLRYSFAVVGDPNPRGAAWLSSVLAQP